MPLSAPLLDIATARRIAQRHVGESAQVNVCWQRPEGIYTIHASDDDVNFYFAILEPLHHLGVGGTRHIAVDRSTGAVRELGMLGE